MGNILLQLFLLACVLLVAVPAEHKVMNDAYGFIKDSSKLVEKAKLVKGEAEGAVTKMTELLISLLGQMGPRGTKDTYIGKLKDLLHLVDPSQVVGLPTKPTEIPTSKPTEKPINTKVYDELQPYELQSDSDNSMERVETQKVIAIPGQPVRVQQIIYIMGDNQLPPGFIAPSAKIVMNDTFGFITDSSELAKKEKIVKGEVEGAVKNMTGLLMNNLFGRKGRGGTKNRDLASLKLFSKKMSDAGIIQFGRPKRVDLSSFKAKMNQMLAARNTLLGMLKGIVRPTRKPTEIPTSKPTEKPINTKVYDELQPYELQSDSDNSMERVETQKVIAFPGQPVRVQQIIYIMGDNQLPPGFIAPSAKIVMNDTFGFITDSSELAKKEKIVKGEVEGAVKNMTGLLMNNLFGRKGRGGTKNRDLASLKLFSKKMSDEGIIQFGRPKRVDLSSFKAKMNQMLAARNTLLGMLKGIVRPTRKPTEIPTSKPTEKPINTKVYDELQPYELQSDSDNSMERVETQKVIAFPGQPVRVQQIIYIMGDNQLPPGFIAPSAKIVRKVAV